MHCNEFNIYFHFALACAASIHNLSVSLDCYSAIQSVHFTTHPNTKLFIWLFCSFYNTFIWYKTNHIKHIYYISSQTAHKMCLKTVFNFYILVQQGMYVLCNTTFLWTNNLLHLLHNTYLEFLYSILTTLPEFISQNPGCKNVGNWKEVGVYLGKMTCLLS
jgi:hypothetical protein